MKVIIISGFLGVGKTTFLLNLAKDISRTKKTVIIENEIGKIGIDDKYLKNNGLEVKELYSGCVCCSLSFDLVNTVKQVNETFDPEIVILEPTGIASPSMVISNLDECKNIIEEITTIMIIDPIRINNMPNLDFPLFTAGSDIADFVILNKIDLLDNPNLTKAENRLSKLIEDIPYNKISAINQDTINTINHNIIKKINTSKSKKTKDNFHSKDNKEAHHHGDNHPTTYILEKNNIIIKDKALNTKKVVIDFLNEFRNKLKEKKCSLIGHIKSIVRINDDMLFLSCTDFTSPINVKGSLNKTHKKFDITINSIVYGIDENILKKILNDVFNNYF